MGKTMEQMMAGLQNPLIQELNAKYENARISVDKAYKLAENMTPYDYFEVDDKGEKVRKDYTMVERASHLVTVARLIAPEIQKDLDAAINILKGNDESKPA